MTSQSIYRNPVFLNSSTHASLKIAPMTSYKFFRNLNSIVIVGQEFLEAAKYYPVVFTKSQSDEIIPLALLGLRNNENLFIDDQGIWKEGTYIPAFCRRYPFILVNNARQDGSFTVAIDSDYEGFGKDEGMSLFDEQGNVTPEFQRSIDFLKNYNMQYEITKDLVRMLGECSLFKDISASITLPKGEKLGFKKLMMIDEAALITLDNEKIIEFFRKGYLAWIYSHLYSLSNFRSLMALASKNDNGEAVTPKEESGKS